MTVALALITLSFFPRPEKCDLIGWHQSDDIAVLECHEYNNHCGSSGCLWVPRTTIHLQRGDEVLKTYVTVAEPGTSSIIFELFLNDDARPEAVSEAQSLRILRGDNAKVVRRDLASHGFVLFDAKIDEVAVEAPADRKTCNLPIDTEFVFPFPSAVAAGVSAVVRTKARLRDRRYDTRCGVVMARHMI